MQMMRDVRKIYQRHAPESRNEAANSRKKCRCPYYYDVWVKGKRVRRSLKTSDYDRANERLAEILESFKNGREAKSIAAAVAEFLADLHDRSEGTMRNHRRALASMQRYLEASGCRTIDAVTFSTLKGLRAQRSIGARTWTRELASLRMFFAYCMKCKWIGENPAKELEMPKNLKETPKDPYSSEELIAILAAAETIGRAPYERLRARAMILILRHTALRISDVALLERSRVKDGRILIRTMKTGQVVSLKVAPELQHALDTLPVPRETVGESKFFFWSGNGTKQSMIRDAERTTRAVYKASGVVGAHNHRFRHTLASELLRAGWSHAKVAKVLGNSAQIVERHYDHFSIQWQDSIDEVGTLLQPVSTFGTKLVQSQTESVSLSKNEGNLVDGMGFEPTTPTLRTWCSPN